MGLSDVDAVWADLISEAIGADPGTMIATPEMLSPAGVPDAERRDPVSVAGVPVPSETVESTGEISALLEDHIKRVGGVVAAVDSDPNRSIIEAQALLGVNYTPELGKLAGDIFADLAKSLDCIGERERPQNLSKSQLREVKARGMTFRSLGSELVYLPMIEDENDFELKRKLVVALVQSPDDDRSMKCIRLGAQEIGGFVFDLYLKSGSFVEPYVAIRIRQGDDVLRGLEEFLQRKEKTEWITKLTGLKGYVFSVANGSESFTPEGLEKFAWIRDCYKFVCSLGEKDCDAVFEAEQIFNCLKGLTEGSDEDGLGTKLFDKATSLINSLSPKSTEK